MDKSTATLPLLKESVPAARPRPESHGRAALGYSKPLDGIRGIAVLAVLGHSLEVGWVKGGFFGVDIFFALSGFLITTLLLDEYFQRGAISLRDFFTRRCIRLYPALVLLVVASALSSMARAEVDLARVGVVVASTLLYFSNWVVIADSQAWMGGMGHTWSLAVEMHFYVLWALTLVLVTRRWGANFKILLTFAAFVVVASASWRIGVWSGSGGTNRAYAGTDTRLDAIFLGVMAALIRLKHLGGLQAGEWVRLKRWSVRALEVFLVAAVAWLIFQTPNFSPVSFLGGFGIVGGATALLILTTLLSEHSLMRNPLQARVLVWFGQLSYSLYLWHLPVGKFVTPDRLERIGAASWMVDVVRILLSVALAAASYYGVERAFAHLRKRKNSLVRSGGLGVDPHGRVAPS